MTIHYEGTPNVRLFCAIFTIVGVWFSPSSQLSCVVSCLLVHLPASCGFVARAGVWAQDDKYVLGVRVLLRSIRNTGSKHDMVCIIASNVRESTREYFKREGCIVKEVPNIPNPYKASQERRRTYKPRFEFSFNKLYVRAFVCVCVCVCLSRRCVSGLCVCLVGSI